MDGGNANELQEQFLPCASRHKHILCKLAPTVVLVFCVFLAACGDDAVTLPPLPPDAVILAFGDSLTHGTGAKDYQSYPAVLAERIGRKVINAGIPGEETDKGLRRLPGLLDRYQPQLLILCHGGNDILRKRDAASTEANLRAMVRVARERNISVVMIGVPNLGLFLNSADFYENIAADMQVPIDDAILADLLGDNHFKSDYVHPNANGYARLAEAVQTLLNRHGAL
jgi:acyl-CoA thioesterase I